jgi:vacuolar protein sorting-associated protein 35
MRFTFPSLISSAIKLARRWKLASPTTTDWELKVNSLLKFIRQLISILTNQVDSPTVALRLFLLAAQISDECGFEDMTYDFYVQAFTVYEEGISESRAQLQAVTLIIGTLQGSKVFGPDNFDTLITKAALHGSKLLKKSHQSAAVQLASHMWWQQASSKELVTETEIGNTESPEGAKAVSGPRFMVQFLLSDLSLVTSVSSGR